jgi:hypothetical protein
MTLYIGIDPSVVDSGIALECNGTSISDHVPIEEAGAFLDKVFLMDLQGADRVLAMIEDPPPGRGRRGHHTFSLDAVRSAAKAWERAIIKRWARKNKIFRATPSEWRIATFGNSRLSGTTKDPALDYTGKSNHNEAEAICILRYLKLTTRAER